jgi:hypothetical protein
VKPTLTVLVLPTFLSRKLPLVARDRSSLPSTPLRLPVVTAAVVAS